MLPQSISRHKRTWRNLRKPDISGDLVYGTRGRGVCLGYRVEMPGNIQLLVAAFDLKVVQSLRNAINSNLPKTGPLGTIPVGARFHGGGTGVAPREVVHPEPRYEPRRVIHPEVRYEMRPVIHPMPRVEDQPVPFVGYDAPIQPKQSTNPLQPPWAMPIWCEPIPEIPPAAKVVVVKVDNSRTGALLDMFV